jgi:hypothetical protein
MEVVDDYTVHADGFWNEVTAGDCSIRVYVDEGSGDSFLFWGNVKGADSAQDEYYVSGSTYRRTMKIVLVSRLEEMRDTTIAQALGAYLTPFIVEGASDQFQFVKIKDIIASAVEFSFDAPDDDTDDVVVINEVGGDFKYLIDGDVEKDFADLWVKYSKAPTPGGVYAVHGYFDPAHAHAWASKFDNAYQLVQAIASQFGYCVQYFYDIANSRDRVRLIQRGRARSATVDPGILLSSQYRNDAPMKLNSVWSYMRTDQTHSAYQYWGYYTNVQPPDRLEFDVEIACEFLVKASGVYDWQELWFIDTTDGNAEYSVAKVKYYQYDNATTETISAGSGLLIMEEALTRYLVHRYYQTDQKTYYRSYYPLKGNETGTALIDIGYLVTINSENYMITEVEKDLSTGEVKLTLTLL